MPPVSRGRGEQLKSKYYARLIGRRRSGVTQLLARVDDAHAAGLIPQIGHQAVQANRPEAPAPTRTYTGRRAKQQQADAVQPAPASDDACEALECTEVLSATDAADESSGQEISLVGPVAEDRLALRLRRVAIASAVMAVALMIPVGVQLLHESSRESAPTEQSTTTEIPPSTVAPESVAAPSPPIETITPVITEEKEKTTEIVTPPIVPPPDLVIPPEEPKPKPKPSPTIGVAFTVETKLDVRIKVGSKIVEIENRGAFMRLPPKTYPVSWQAAGSNTWEPVGKLVITDIRPSGQRVRILLTPPKIEKTGTFQLAEAGQ